MSVLDNLDAFCVLFDADGRCLHANRVAAGMLRGAPIASARLPIDDVLADVLPAASIKQLIDACKARSTAVIESAVIRGNEELGWFRFTFAFSDLGSMLLGHDITNSRADEELQRKWAHTVENAGFGIAIGSSDGKTFDYVNPAFAKTHGCSSEELVGTPIVDVFAPEVRADLPRIIEEIHRQGHLCFESRHVRRGGDVFPVRVEATAVRDAAGEIAYRIVNVQDISQEVAAREELLVRKAFFRRMFTDAPVAMAIADLTGRYICANAAMCNMLGYSEAELLEMTYRDVTYGEDVAENDVKRDALVAGEIESFEMEKRYVCKDGRVVWSVMVVSIIKGPDGKALVTLGQMLDIDRLKRTENALRDSEGRLKEAQRVAHMGSWTLDLTTEALIWSDEVFRLFEIDPARFEPTYEAFLNAIHPDDRDTVDAAYRDSLATRAPYEITHRLLMADGRVKWITERCATEFDNGGRPLRSIGTVQDVTEQKIAEQEIERSREQLRDLAAHHQHLLEEERKRIAHEIHDELGQQLSVLKLDVGMLRQDFGGYPGITELAQRMRRSIDHSFNVVRHVVSHLRPAALDLGIVAAIEWLAQDLGARWGIDCEVDAPEDVAADEVTAITAFRIVQESLTNIARHSGARHVSITLRTDSGDLHIAVQDDGCGFDAADPGVRHGHGLFGMRERIRSRRGYLAVESKPGAGTVVRVTLPLSP